MVDPITRWVITTEYNNIKAMDIANLVETTWLVWYQWPVEITYDQVGESPGREFKIIFI